MRKLGLGTVQFGQAYGVSNTSGQVSASAAAAILQLAAQAGVAVLDTAANYGEAEMVLSGLDTSAFRIVTKTTHLNKGLDAVLARVRESKRLLPRADTLLVHMGDDLLGPGGKEFWNALRDLREQDLFRRIGIVAYVAQDPVAMAARFKPDLLQVPFSLLDQRLLQDGSLARLKDMGVEIHVRSLFLQGLLLMPPSALPEKLASAAPHIAMMNTRLAEAGTTPLVAALGFALAQPEIDTALVGVTSLAELDSILEAAAQPLPALDWHACALADERILTPSLWNL